MLDNPRKPMTLSNRNERWSERYLNGVPSQSSGNECHRFCPLNDSGLSLNGDKLTLSSIVRAKSLKECVF